MKIKTEESGDVVILRLDGKLMGGPDSDAFQALVKDLVAANRKKILVDLANVAWVNSSGLGILISGYSTLKQNGGSLKFVNVNKRIDQILMVTKLHTIFDAYDDEARALASF